jgi:hypothetical protein
MGATASIDDKKWRRSVPQVDIIKHQLSYDKEYASDYKFDPLVQEMRFDKMLSTHPSLAEPSEEDLGKELREIYKEDTLRGCIEFGAHKYGKRVWDIIPKSHPQKIHLYEYLASYPSFETLQDRTTFIMRLLMTYLPPDRQVKRYQQPVFTLLDLARLLHDFECIKRKTEFNKNRFMIRAIALLSQMKHENYFHPESIRLAFEEIIQREYQEKPFDDLIQKMEDYELDAQKFSRLIVQMKRIQLGDSKDSLDPFPSDANLSMQPELQLPKPRK